MTLLRDRRALVALVAILVVVQVAIPSWALLQPRPSRFGWQMYGSLNPPPQAQLVRADGEREDVELSERIADPRAEIHWTQPLASALCAGDVVAVIVTDRDGTNRVDCP